MLPEHFGVGGVHLRECRQVSQEDPALQHMGEIAPDAVEHEGEIVQRLLRLGGNSARKLARLGISANWPEQ